jgi:hypothetical protein
VSATHGSHPLARSVPNGDLVAPRATGTPGTAVRLSLTLLATLMLLSPAASRQLTAVHVSAGQDLQAAIDAAKPGDVILLEKGAHFTGNFVLRAHPAGSEAFITIRTDAPDLPKAGVRTGPASSGTLAVLQSPNNLATLSAAPGAHHWRIENVEFGPNRRGDGNIIDLGSSKEKDADRIPSHLVLDRVYVHGDPLWGQKRGIALNSASTDIINSYIADIKGIGMDTQAIVGWSGPGPFTIENNYLEAAGENVMFGGADPAIDGLVPQHIVIRHNQFSRPVEWRMAVLAAPAQVTAAAMGEGMLPAGVYTYKVVAERPTAGGAMAVSQATAASEVKLEAMRAVTIEWAAVPDAAGYRIYRVDASGAIAGFRATDTRFTDTGEPGKHESIAKQPSVWAVKNLLELKNAADVEIDGNLFENHWAGGQPGYAIVFTPRNQDGRAPWSRVENVRFTNNVVRHVSALFNITGVDNNRPSGRAANITIANNLFVDVNGDRWGGRGDFLQMGDGPTAVHVEHNTVDHSGRIISVYPGKYRGQPEGFVFRGNVIRHNAYGVIGQSAAPGKDTLQKFMPDAVFEDNVIAGGNASKYPSGNQFIAVDDFDRYLKGAGRERDAGVNRQQLDAALGSLKSMAE